MVRQGLYRIATFVVLALSAEILMGSVVQGFPKRKDQIKWRGQKNGHHQSSLSRNTTKIVGGEITTIGEFPYQVAIYIDGDFSCGGSLVTSRHVLTAAHCLTKTQSSNLRDKSKYHVVLRSTNHVVLEDNAIIKNVQKIAVHPKYNKLFQEEYDVGIITLTKPVDKRVPLATMETNADFDRTDYVGQTAVALGWGNVLNYLLDTKDPPSKVSDLLKKLEAPVISSQECNRLIIAGLNTKPEFFYKERPQICIKPTKTEGVCKGDSGGPLFVKGVQVGIVSGGYGCADNRFPMIFTRVAIVRPWINSQIIAIEQKSCPKC